MPTVPTAPSPDTRLDAESKAWLERLRVGHPEREHALAELHVLLLRAAGFEVHRRRAAVGQLRDDEGEDLAQQAADDALLAIVRKIGDFRGDSRFTTWAYKFALLEAAVKVRRRAWQDREVQLEPESWSLLRAGAPSPHEDAESRELLSAVRDALDSDLTERQRTVFVAVALNEVPIDVLAERMQSTRGALYKTLHDARRALRASLARRGLELDQAHQAERR